MLFDHSNLGFKVLRLQVILSGSNDSAFKTIGYKQARDNKDDIPDKMNNLAVCSTHMGSNLAHKIIMFIFVLTSAFESDVKHELCSKILTGADKLTKNHQSKHNSCNSRSAFIDIYPLYMITQLEDCLIFSSLGKSSSSENSRESIFLFKNIPSGSQPDLSRADLNFSSWGFQT